MKKTIIAIIAVILIIPFVLGACVTAKIREATSGNGKNDTAVQEQTEKQTEKETESETETESVPEAASAENLVMVVTSLMYSYNRLQFVDAASLDVDEEVVYWDEDGYAYCPVTDPEFQSIGDIWAYLYDTFTTDGANAIFPDLANLGLDDGPYTYIVVDEEDYPKGLYSIQVGNGFSLYSLNGSIQISDKTDTSFTAVCDCEYFGIDTTLTLKVVKDEGKWKINAIDYGGFGGEEEAGGEEAGGYEESDDYEGYDEEEEF